MITHGMDLRKALRVAKKLGCCIVYAGGDVKLAHPEVGSTHRVSGHRRCAPRYLTIWLLSLIAVLAQIS